jgi:hypothetical protein
VKKEKELVPWAQSALWWPHVGHPMLSQQGRGGSMSRHCTSGPARAAGPVPATVLCRGGGGGGGRVTGPLRGPGAVRKKRNRPGKSCEKTQRPCEKDDGNVMLNSLQVLLRNLLRGNNFELVSYSSPRAGTMSSGRGEQSFAYRWARAVCSLFACLPVCCLILLSLFSLASWGRSRGNTALPRGTCARLCVVFSHTHPHHQSAR